MALFVLALAPACPSGSAAPPDLPRDTTTDLRDDAVDRLAWLSGTWVFESDEGVEEEHWSTPRGGMLIGHNRTVRAGRTVHFEFLRIEQRAHGIVYVAAPSGQAQAEFRLTHLVAGKAVFENPEHDFPKRITYRREGRVLHARVEGAPGDRVAEWQWELEARPD